jgi:hypothetical protein
MRWVDANVPPASRFIVLPDGGPTDPWWIARLAEWFPALAHRVSVTTVQGFEWLGNQRWKAQLEAYSNMGVCAQRDVGCLEDVARRSNLSYTHVYVPPEHPAAPTGEAADCCWPLRSSLRASPSYIVIYDGPGGTIFQRRS